MHKSAILPQRSHPIFSQKPATPARSSTFRISDPSSSNIRHIAFLVPIGNPGWSQYLVMIPFACAVATCFLSKPNCVELNVSATTSPNWATKSAEAMGESYFVIFSKAVLRYGSGAS